MDLALFDYDLPPSSIAQEPAEPRDASRLLLLDRARRRWEDHGFGELPALLRSGDCLVVNTSRVIPARLLGELASGGRPVELLLLRARSATQWEALARPARHCRRGARILLAGGQANATVVGEGPMGARVIDIETSGPVEDLLERHGLPPLPPYIDRHRSPKPEDRERYQTVYAREGSSVAAPTAGLHFTRELMQALGRHGIEIHELQLDVGPGTFRPVVTARVDEHSMGAEETTIPVATAAAVNRARAEGRRVVAVGTTSARALEWAAGEDGRIAARAGAADVFIHPPYRFKAVDALLTNFHLPRSTLLLLVSALAGRELVLDAYRHAVDAGYRFYSYGDAMLVV